MKANKISQLVNLRSSQDAKTQLMQQVGNKAKLCRTKYKSSDMQYNSQQFLIYRDKKKKKETRVTTFKTIVNLSYVLVSLGTYVPRSEVFCSEFTWAEETLASQKKNVCVCFTS